MGESGSDSDVLIMLVRNRRRGTVVILSLGGDDFVLTAVLPLTVSPGGAAAGPAAGTAAGPAAGLAVRLLSAPRAIFGSSRLSLLARS